jgi:hypothetical protein
MDGPRFASAVRHAKHATNRPSRSADSATYNRADRASGMTAFIGAAFRARDCALRKSDGRRNDCHSEN